MTLICSHAYYLKLKSFFIGESLLPHLSSFFKRLCKNQIHLRCESNCFGKIWFQAYEWDTLKKQSICVRKTSVFLSLTKFSVHQRSHHLACLASSKSTSASCERNGGKEQRDVCAQEPVGTRSFYSSLMGCSSTWNFLHWKQN